MMLSTVVIIILLLTVTTQAFTPTTRFTACSRAISKTTSFPQSAALFASKTSGDDDDDDRQHQHQQQVHPQVFATGYSTQTNLAQALQEAVSMAVQGLFRHHQPETDDSSIIKVDLAMVSISSLYDGASSSSSSSSSSSIPSSAVLSVVLQAADDLGIQIQHIVGQSVAGCISSKPAINGKSGTTIAATTACQPVEFENVPAVSVTLAQLPDCNVRTFHLETVPDDIGRLSPAEWKRAIGLTSFLEDNDNNNNSNENEDAPLFWLVPSPAFSRQVDDLVYGLNMYFPGSQIVGGIASTVSSLSRAKLYQWSAADVSGGTGNGGTFTAGCVGIALTGDIQLQTMTAQGAKPVGGIYQILKGQESTISVIVLDETATEALQEEGAEDELEQDDDYDDASSSEENGPVMDAKAAAAQAYAKARIPKPVLAEANFLMRTLSDDDQAFMRRALLIGLEHQGSTTSYNELTRLAAGQGHRFWVQQVASAGMKDGSVTLPLGSVNVSPGMRLRFFVREAEFAKKEMEALWLGYKKRILNQQFLQGQSSSNENNDKGEMPFSPTACFILPTLDRGSKFFSGKPGYESNTAARMMPSVPCITGFFSNGVIAPHDGNEDTRAGVQGSVSGYFLIGSKSGRPLYTAAMAIAEKERVAEKKAAKEAKEQALAAENAKRLARTKDMTGLEEKAPRDERGELVLKRREIHSGRALTVSTVEWSVAEKTAKPTSTLEGYMWDKETEVDRFRERVPLANLVSQCRTSASDPTQPKPRDFAKAIKGAAKDGAFVIIPECKRAEPVSGSLRKRYDISKLTRDFTLAGVPALSVNSDGVLFGGSMEDVTAARRASSAAAVEQMSEDGVLVPPILASDLLLYPYQLYKLRLAGADAVNLVVGALSAKDLLYLTKIAASLQLQVFVSVTSKVQIKAVTDLAPGSFAGVVVSNRELEDFSFDMTGEQALSLLESEEMAALRKKHGDNMPILVEGRVGMIERQGSTTKYIEELRKAGAIGAIVGGGLAVEDSSGPIARLQTLQLVA